MGVIYDYERDEMMTDRHECAVLGSPIAHSLSPVLHQAAYRALRLTNWHYTRQEMVQSDLASFLHTRDKHWVGVSLTMPLKHTVIHYGIPSDRYARLLRVANTAVFDHDQQQIFLYNTDVYGIVSALDSALGLNRMRVRRAVIIGSGNTAMSALAALYEIATMSELEQVTMIARCNEHGVVKGVDRAQQLYDYLSNHHGEYGFLDQPHTIQVEGLEFEPHNSHVLAALEQADIVISTVPAHIADEFAQTLHLASDSALYDCPNVGDQAVLLDVVYDPRPSDLLRAWSCRGRVSMVGK